MEIQTAGLKMGMKSERAMDIDCPFTILKLNCNVVHLLMAFF